MELVPGGGEAWLTAPRDTAVTRPVFQPKPLLVVERSDEVKVLRWWSKLLDCTGSTVSDRLVVVTEDMNDID